MEYFFLEGDTLATLKELDDNSVDSIVSDPPYGLGKEPNIVEVMSDWIKQGYHEIKTKGGGFMGKEWDSFVPQPIVFKEAYRVLKHGGYALIACGTRTQDWMAASLRFAGFEVRDVITWHYGSGFPKSLDISKAIDKKFGAEREVVGTKKTGADNPNGKETLQLSKNTFINECGETVFNITAPSTEEAKKYSGYGTALKPATEFWTLVRKPLSESTVAENVLKHGTGGINIDGCRIGETTVSNGGKANIENNWIGAVKGYTQGTIRENHDYGRFPANVIFDDFTADLLDQQTGILTSGTGSVRTKSTTIDQKFAGINPQGAEISYSDSGGASRFFYVAKPSKKERSAGLDGFEEKKGGSMVGAETREGKPTNHPIRANFHPTVKPIKLMQYLVRLITPKGGICLDMYAGSGTTGCACALENIDCILIDNVPEYVEIGTARIEHYKLESGN